MPEIPHGWIEKNNSLRKNFIFDGFPAALAFMVEVGFFCEKNDHHPDWKNSYNKIEVSLTTHDAKKVTGKDRKLAAHMDKIFMKFAEPRSSAK